MGLRGGSRRVVGTVWSPADVHELRWTVEYPDGGILCFGFTMTTALKGLDFGHVFVFGRWR